jgi:hypothetical protein
MIMWLLLGIALLLVLWGRREGIDETLQPNITEEEIEEYNSFIRENATNPTPQEWQMVAAASPRFLAARTAAREAANRAAAAAAAALTGGGAWTAAAVAAAQEASTASLFEFNKMWVARQNAIEREAKKRLTEAAAPTPPEPTPLLEDPAKVPPPPPEPSQAEDAATSSAPVSGADEVKFLNEPTFSPLPPPALTLPPRPELSLPSAPMPVAASAPEPVGGNVQSIPISTADGPVVVNIYGSKDILSGNNNGKIASPLSGGPTPVPQQSA